MLSLYFIFLLPSFMIFIYVLFIRKFKFRFEQKIILRSKSQCQAYTFICVNLHGSLKGLKVIG